MGVALYIDDGHDMYGLLLLVEFFDYDLRGVGHLLIVVEEQLLADDLCDEESGWLVGEGILAEIWWRYGEELDDAPAEMVDFERLARALRGARAGRCL